MIIPAEAFLAMVEELDKIAETKTHREAHGVHLDVDIPVIDQLPEAADKIKTHIAGAIDRVERSTWSHPQVAVPVKMLPSLSDLGFEPTRMAVPLPGEKLFTRTWRAGRLHAHKQGPFYLFHQDKHPGRYPTPGHIIGDGAKAILKLLRDTPRVPVLQLEKAAEEMVKISRRKRKDEFAPGIPKDKRIQSVRPVTKGKSRNFKLVVQHHPAKRAGNHYDIRLGDPRDRAGHSWATKKELPKPGERAIRIYQQPTHTWEYLDFEGPLFKGYGATKKGKKVKAVVRANVPVHYANDEKIRFDWNGQKFLMAKARKSGNPKSPTWYLINVSPKPKTKTAARVWTPESIHRRLGAFKVPREVWDNNPEFMAWTKRLVGKAHLDDMTPEELRRVAIGVARKYKPKRPGPKKVRKFAGRPEIPLTRQDRIAINARLREAGLRHGSVGLKHVDEGYAAHTHRARTKFYPSPTAIPLEKLRFIASTG